MSLAPWTATSWSPLWRLGPDPPSGGRAATFTVTLYLSRRILPNSPFLRSWRAAQAWLVHHLRHLGVRRGAWCRCAGTIRCLVGSSVAQQLRRPYLGTPASHCPSTVAGPDLNLVGGHAPAGVSLNCETQTLAS